MSRWRPRSLRSMNAADVLQPPAVEPVQPAKTIAAAARPRPGLASRISIVGWRLIALAIFLVVWHLASIPAGKLLLPSPLDVVPISSKQGYFDTEVTFPSTGTVELSWTYPTDPLLGLSGQTVYSRQVQVTLG